MSLFESFERRIPQIQPILDKYGFANFEEVKAFNNSKGVDAYGIVEKIQPIAFENAKWAYELGAAIALKEDVKTAAEAAECIGVALQAFCIPGSVADQRKVGLEIMETMRDFTFLGSKITADGDCSHKIKIKPLN